jgi:hypothetical protein
MLLLATFCAGSADAVPFPPYPNAKKEKTDGMHCFESLTPDMSVGRMAELCGNPDENIGIKIFILIWDFKDGSRVVVDTPTLDKIFDAGYINHKGIHLRLTTYKKMN